MQIERMTETGDIGARLKALRERAGVSVRDMAAALGMSSPSSYTHYEVRFKKPYLPTELAEQIAPILAERGIDPAEVFALAVPSRGGAEFATGFAEPAADGSDVAALLKARKLRNEATDPKNTIKIAIVGDTIQVAATVDADGIDELYRRLDLARQMLD